MGLFVAVKLKDEDNKKINNYVKKLNSKFFKELNKIDEYHITLAYAKKEFNYKPYKKEINYPIEFSKLDILGRDEKYLVLKLNPCKFLKERFKSLVNNGYEHGFDQYIPHLTLGELNKEFYDYDFSSINVPEGKFHIDHEYSEALKEDFMSFQDFLFEKHNFQA